jgi:hypothetical protein
LLIEVKKKKKERENAVFKCEKSGGGAKRSGFEEISRRRMCRCGIKKIIVISEKASISTGMWSEQCENVERIKVYDFQTFFLFLFLFPWFLWIWYRTLSIVCYERAKNLVRRI